MAKSSAKSAKPAKAAKKEVEVTPITVNADQLSFNNDKEIDNMARFLEERITPRSGLKEVVRSKNTLELKLTKPVSKRLVKQYLTKYLHRAGLRLDYRVLATFQGKKEADFHIYPRRVFEI